MSSLLNPEERVLSTLNADGSRRWLDPKDVTGRFRSSRKTIGWILIAIFVVPPHLHLSAGSAPDAEPRQMFFADIAAGEFTLFGVTFLRTDTLLLALGLITIALSVFLVTALFGRVWCGWACPQTVYLEFVFRPLAKLFDGKGKKGVRGRVSKLPKQARVGLRWLLVAVICFFLANTFLAYFVGSRTVLSWSTQAPWVHPLGFGFVVAVTGLMIGNFGFFREQLCFIACPYGRLQSVLLDKHSLIVGYDTNRGEPRGRTGKKRAKADPGAVDLPLPVIKAQDAYDTGDCVDCNRCVAVCPTGIDIRDGLQLECIACARCIDACDTVMTKLGKDRGLIRYSSQSVLAGDRGRFIRPRTVLYPLILLIVSGSLIFLSASHASADVRVIRDKGQPFYTLPTGEISNQIRVRITNRSHDRRSYSVAVDEPGFRIQLEDDTAEIDPGETRSVRVLLIGDREAISDGLPIRRVGIQISDDDGLELTRPCKFLAPLNLDQTQHTVPAEPATEATQTQASAR